MFVASCSSELEGIQSDNDVGFAVQNVAGETRGYTGRGWCCPPRVGPRGGRVASGRFPPPEKSSRVKYTVAPCSGLRV